MTVRPDPRVVASLLVIAVVVAVGAGLMLVGPPTEERARRRDSQRINDLFEVSRALDRHWTKLSLMPASLDDLKKGEPGPLPIADKFSNQPYEYRHVDSNAFEICATFERDASSATQLNYWDAWPHGVGRTCFRRVARRNP